jgi:hypothetical protein
MPKYEDLIKKFISYKLNHTELMINNMDTRSPDIRVITIDYVGPYFAKGHSSQYSDDLGYINIPATLLYADLVATNSGKSAKIIVKKELPSV